MLRSRYSRSSYYRSRKKTPTSKNKLSPEEKILEMAERIYKQIKRPSKLSPEDRKKLTKEIVELGDKLITPYKVPQVDIFKRIKRDGKKEISVAGYLSDGKVQTRFFSFITRYMERASKRTFGKQSSRRKKGIKEILQLVRQLHYDYYTKTPHKIERLNKFGGGGQKTKKRVRKYTQNKRKRKWGRRKSKSTKRLGRKRKSRRRKPKSRRKKRQTKRRNFR